MKVNNPEATAINNELRAKRGLPPWGEQNSALDLISLVNAAGEPKYAMNLSENDYSEALAYITEALRGGHINVAKLDLCKWIIEKVADGTITVE